MSSVPNRETFESAYAGRAPWDIDGPQKAIVEVADRIAGSILDAGCGTGENALFFAGRGHKVTGIDFLVWRQLDFPADDHYFSRTHQPVVIRSQLEPGGLFWPAPRDSLARSTPRSRNGGPVGRSPPPSSSRP